MLIEVINTDPQYWIGTFLSNNAEITAAFLFVVVAGISALIAEDALEAIIGLSAFGSLGYGMAGWNVVLEWHYWAIPAVLFILFGLYELNKKSPIERIID